MGSKTNSAPPASASSHRGGKSLDATILPFARQSLAADPDGRNDLLALLTRFTETERWDDPETLMAAYGHHNAVVERTVPSDCLLQWHPGDGWGPICDALGLPVPESRSRG